MDFKIIRGTLPVLISAPHSTLHLRPGFKAQKPKLNELNTDLVVKTLCKKAGWFGIYATKIQKRDPNWYEDCPYKKAIERLVDKHNIKFVLDIHGARKDRPFLIEYDDFRKGKIIMGIEENLKQCLKKFGFSEKEIVRGLLHKNNQLTITEFCIERLKIPALQLEINKKIRNPQNPTFNSLLSALKCFLQTL